MTNPTQDLTVSLHMTPEIQSQINRGLGAMDIANAYVIDSPEMANAASSDSTQLAKAIDELERVEDGFIAPAKQIIENAKGFFRPAITTMKQARGIILGKLRDYTVEQERRAAEARRKADEEARRLRQEADRRAAEERARAAEKAAAERRAAEEAEQRRRDAEAAGNAKAAAAAAAEAARAAEKAAAIEENAEAKVAAIQTEAVLTTPAPVVAPAKVAGTALKDNWIGRLKAGYTEDKAKTEIVAACVARPELLALLEVDLSAINKLAKALHEAMNVPGFEAFNDRKMAGARK